MIVYRSIRCEYYSVCDVGPKRFVRRVFFLLRAANTAFTACECNVFMLESNKNTNLLLPVNVPLCIIIKISNLVIHENFAYQFVFNVNALKGATF